MMPSLKVELRIVLSDKVQLLYNTLMTNKHLFLDTMTLLSISFKPAVS